jgi:hypothetical protein
MIMFNSARRRCAWKNAWRTDMRKGNPSIHPNKSRMDTFIMLARDGGPRCISRNNCEPGRERQLPVR